MNHIILDARVVKGSGGGPDKTIINSPAYLAPHGYRMLCAYMHAPEDAGYPKLQAKAAQKGVELISIPDRGPFDHKVINHTLALCRKEKVTVWHGHDYKSNLLGLIIYPMYPMRLVTTVHGWVEKTNRTPLYYWIDRSTLRFYEKVICVSDDLYEMSRQAGVPKSRCVLLENGIDVTDFQRRQSVLDAKVKLGINPNHFLIGAVGRLSGEKGFDLLIKSIDTLLSQGQSQMQLAIFGEGKEAENLQKQINELGRQDQIKLMGFQTDLRACYEAMDLFVLSSLREGLPNVVLEAMAMEVPVVSTRVAGIPKLLTHDINGYLLDAGSSEALTSAIGTVISDKQRLDRFRHEGRRTVETRFNFAIRMEKLRLLYDELLQKPKAIAGAKQ
jgi:glycosyltransferase involved in cell wall biosynthesis